MITQKIFQNNICFLTGFQRSGKSLVTALLPSLKKIEIINKEPVLGAIFSMYLAKEIKLDAAKYLISFVLSNVNYSNYLGRKLNLKRTDETSIFNLLDYKNIIKRINSTQKKNFVKINNKKTIIYDLHNLLLDPNLWTSLDRNIKIINIERHPISLIYSWCKKGFGNFKYSSISQILLYKFQKTLVPFYAIKWKKDYERMSECDRIISTIYNCTLEKNSQLKNLKKKTALLKLKYESFLEKPYENLKKINNFLNFNKKPILFKNYKNKINLNKRETKQSLALKLNFLKKNSTKTSFKKILKLSQIYTDEK